MEPAVEARQRDDRVLPETRWASLLIVIFLVPALVILWGLPDQTGDLWAWTISPDLTPIFMGATYGAGAYFFGRLYLSRQWHPASAVVLGVGIYAGLMLVTTLIHWDKFNHGDAPFLAAVAFYVWVSLYILAPPLVIALWLRNRQTDPRRAEPQDPIVPVRVRLMARVFVGGAFLAAGFFLLWPDGAIDAWPWELTPLTARALGCLMAQIAVSALVLSLDERWSSWRRFVQTFFVTTALLLVGAVRARADFDESNPLTWLYLGGLMGGALSLAMLYRSMETRRPDGS